MAELRIIAKVSVSLNENLNKARDRLRKLVARLRKVVAFRSLTAHYRGMLAQGSKRQPRRFPLRC